MYGPKNCNSCGQGVEQPNKRRNVIFFLILIKSFGLPHREVIFFMKKRPNIQSTEEYLMYFWA